MSRVKDLKLANQGIGKIYWAETKMPVLLKIQERFAKEKPFKGKTIGCCLHVTKETAVLVKTLKAGGARVGLCAANPLSTQDDVAAALLKEGIEVFAWRNLTNKEYYDNVNHILDMKPNITIDDGGDLVSTIHTSRPDILPVVYGGCEETTTGVIRLRAMERDGALRYPMIAINDANTKHMFDNRYGTGQSTIDGILRSTSTLIAGKAFVVCGYGWCGNGVAMRARGMGANVIVTEVDPLRALEAVMDGYLVMPMKEAAKIGDIFVTVTGDVSVIGEEHFPLMKDGAILANTGHFNVEINIKALEKVAVKKRDIREYVVEYTLPNKHRLFLLGEGRIINLVAAEGHPSAVMDMSFANQALCSEHIIKNYSELERRVYSVPKAIDKEVAKLKLETMGVRIDKLSKEQENYLTSWQHGTE